MSILSDLHDLSLEVIKGDSRYFRKRRALYLNQGTKCFNHVIITVNKDKNLLTIIALCIMSLKHPDSIGHSHAHQKVSIAYIMDFGTGNLDLQLHSRL